MLEYVKQKTAEEDSPFARLPQPMLLECFRRFADAAMALVHRHAAVESCAEQFRASLRNVLREIAGPAAADARKSESHGVH